MSHKKISVGDNHFAGFVGWIRRAFRRNPPLELVDYAAKTAANPPYMKKCPLQSKKILELILPNETETLNLGSRLADLVPNQAIIFLTGELGAGKTTLVRGFLNKLGHLGAVKSPTYTLVESYEIGHKVIFHFDLYRLKSPGELELIGIRDYFSNPAIILIEWPEKGAGQLPQPDLTCYIETLKIGRRVELTAASQTGLKILEKLSAYYGKM